MSMPILHVRVQAAYPCPSCISMSMGSVAMSILHFHVPVRAVWYVCVHVHVSIHVHAAYLLYMYIYMYRYINVHIVYVNVYVYTVCR
jgi:hypothetical protein